MSNSSQKLLEYLDQLSKRQNDADTRLIEIIRHLAIEIDLNQENEKIRLSVAKNLDLPTDSGEVEQILDLLLNPEKLEHLNPQTADAEAHVFGISSDQFTIQAPESWPDPSPPKKTSES
ncbi:hypothetical protein [Undibacterium umbellatum]|uniref:Uncharacterized protein n=1 Tax=Undibacterium umbellatum TaxID=2762300 RepID=A0ABR6Z390_9BURK|nr:hypothetical protein [Undibacterium umbellatum]MBC3906192.1 hypothetical protein [Undibacterium umbellatum]